MGTLAVEGDREQRWLRVGMSVARKVWLATSVAPRGALVHQAPYAQRHVGQASRIGSKN
jgi:hypothetical protein